MKRLPGARTLLTILLYAAGLAAGSAFAQDDGPVIYAIINEQQAGELADLFTERTGLKPAILRGSTGEIIARVLAEKDNPRADIVLGGPSTLHINLKEEGATEPHELPEGLTLQEGTFDPDGYWTGWHATALGIGINTERFSSRYGDRPWPETWEDLLDPAWKGEIVMTDPVASSTAYLFVQLQLQRLGWDAGWDYLQALVDQVGQLPGSGAAPTQLVSSGEYTLGVSYIHPLSRNLAQGMPLHIVVPPETGGEIGAVSVVRGGPNGEAAHRFVNFILSAEAQQLLTERSRTTTLKPEVVLPEGTVPVTAIGLIDFDPELAAEQRDEVLELWSSLVD